MLTKGKKHSSMLAANMIRPNANTPHSLQRSAQYPINGRAITLVAANEEMANPTTKGEPPNWVM